MSRYQDASVQGLCPHQSLEIRGEHFYQVTVGKKLVSNQINRRSL